MDTLFNGVDNILSVLLDRNVNGYLPDNITEFWSAWFQTPSFGHDQAMRDIWYEHGIGCCVGIRGNVDGDPQDIIDISDLTYLTDYMFGGGTAPPCMEEADVDDSGGIDIADLVHLVNYIFCGGVAPSNCQ